MNYRKETSERSDDKNWVKKLLIEKTQFNFDSIEGCNQNTKDLVTHLLERARVDIISDEIPSNKEVLQKIIELESEETLLRKIRFCNCFGIGLSYVVYSNEAQKVFIYEIDSLNEIKLIQEFSSYKQFSNWLSSIKGWISTKPYREIDELPIFDKELRKIGTPWPTNIDCFVASVKNEPIAILEFQNAYKVNLMEHCNNSFFWGITSLDDQRRWHSQEILRVQSNLPLLIITWSEREDGFIFKEVEKIVLPYSPDRKTFYDNKNLLQRYVKTNKSSGIYKQICDNMCSFELVKKDGMIQKNINKPPLSVTKKTFPMIYYKKKILENGSNNKIIDLFSESLSGDKVQSD